MSRSTDHPKVRRRTWPEWTAAALLLAATLAWAIGVGRVLYCAGEYFIGFHPLLLFLPLFAFGLFLAALIGCGLRKWKIAGASALSILVLALFVTHGWRIHNWAWTSSIHQHDQANRAAIRAAPDLPDFTYHMMHKLGDDEAMPVLDGFEWYCDHPVAAPDDKFRAFRYRGVVHIRVQKIRHGYRGLALAPSPADREKLGREPTLTYEEPARGDWLIWRVGG